MRQGDLAGDSNLIIRDYLQTGFYTEVLFRQYDVHFVAVGNNARSNEFAPFLNIMNAWYLRDLSRKQRAAIKVKGESGEPKRLPFTLQKGPNSGLRRDQNEKTNRSAQIERG